MVRRDGLQIACSETFDQLLIVETSYKRSATYYRKIPFAGDFDRHHKALQTCVAFVFDRCACLDGFPMSDAAIGITKFLVCRGRLQGAANRVVVRHYYGRRLRAIDEKD